MVQGSRQRQQLLKMWGEPVYEVSDSAGLRIDLHELMQEVVDVWMVSLSNNCTAELRESGCVEEKDSQCQ